jgi:hypothetical protein
VTPSVALPFAGARDESGHAVAVLLVLRTEAFVQLTLLDDHDQI